MAKPPRGWRTIRKISPKENLGLPIPRLEIRYKPFGGELFALYSLVYMHLEGEILNVPLSGTMCSGHCLTVKEYLEAPFRSGAQMVHDMWNMRLPGYVVHGTRSKGISLDKGEWPGALTAIINQQLPIRSRPNK